MCLFEKTHVNINFFEAIQFSSIVNMFGFTIRIDNVVFNCIQNLFSKIELQYNSSQKWVQIEPSGTLFPF